MKTMMHHHLNRTSVEAVARETHNYALDTVAYENVHIEILEMADMLSEGIIKQFPDKFKSSNDQNVELADSRIVLKQNAPNPFADKTVISYSIPESVSRAQIVFYNNN